ncbi:MAG: LysR family transcriptional regulator [Thermaerobacterales bacterium]
MEERRLKTFLTAAQMGSFSRAAAVLFVTQSTVTARINELERELGSKLFFREGRGVSLTESGRVFVRYTQRCLQNLEEAREAVTAVESGQEGRFRVMACHVPAAYDLPKILAGNDWPARGPQIYLQTGSSKRIFRQMLAGEVDLGLVNVRFLHPDLETEIIAERPLAVVRRNQGSSPRAIDASEPLLYFQEELEDALMARSICHRLGWPTGALMGLSDMAALKNMLRCGLAAGIVPAAAVAEETAAGDLTATVVEDGYRLPSQITCLLVRRGARSGPFKRAIETFAGATRRFYSRAPERLTPAW